MIKTILVDDHALFCEGLEKLLAETGGFNVIGKFSSGKDFLQSEMLNEAHLLIIDVEMPDMNGFDVVKRLRLRDPRIKIAILSMHQELVYSNEASVVGANAYLSKSIDSLQLVEKLMRICDGEDFFSKRIMPSFTRQESLLSIREIDVLRRLVRGKTNDEISSDLSISPLTVKTHRKNMVRKLNVKNSPQLIMKAMELGII